MLYDRSLTALGAQVRGPIGTKNPNYKVTLAPG
jgi:hypothetical protein